MPPAFSAWAEIFGDPVAVAAMVDRLVHYAEVIFLKGDSYCLRDSVRRADRAEGALTCSDFGRRFLLRFGPALTCTGSARL